MEDFLIPLGLQCQKLNISKELLMENLSGLIFQRTVGTKKAVSLRFYGVECKFLLETVSRHFIFQSRDFPGARHGK